ncbi:MAG: class I SAM-dependent methyltransferase [Candidatus Dormibacteria bacterium]
MSIHPSASTGFSSAAASYERGRPGYPRPAVEWLCRRLELAPGRTVLDLGAGTGKLTRELLSSGASVVALEPLTEMAEVLRRVAPEATVLTATAAETGLSADAVDAATAGQAFHWFSDESSLREIHRVLRPGARLGLVWNHRDLTDPLWRNVDALMEGHRHGEPTYRSGEWRKPLTDSHLFLEPEGRVFEHHQALTPEQLVDRVVSVSYIAILARDERVRLAEQVRRLGLDSARRTGELVDLPYRTEVWITRAIP